MLRHGNSALNSINYSTDNSVCNAIIQKVRGQGLVYYSALDQSVRAAQDGYKFSDDAEYLCDFLLDPKNSQNDLQEFVADMRTTARRAHKDAVEMSEKFRSVRSGLHQV